MNEKPHKVDHEAESSVVRVDPVGISSSRRGFLAAALAITFTSSGCLTELIATSFMMADSPSFQPDFVRMTKQSMTANNVSVAVVCRAPNNVKWDFDNIDQALAKYVTYRLRAKRVTVFNPDVVQAWMDKNEDWDKPEEIGAALGATYVISIDLRKFTLFEPDSPNLFRGRAEAMVSVVAMDENQEGGEIYAQEVASQYPLDMARSTSEVTHSKFKRQYLVRLSEDIGRLFYEHYEGEGMRDDS
jgi:hypothetical protein